MQHGNRAVFSFLWDRQEQNHLLTWARYQPSLVPPFFAVSFQDSQLHQQRSWPAWLLGHRELHGEHVRTRDPQQGRKDCSKTCEGFPWGPSCPEDTTHPP